jgi:hypothetical protein
MERLWSAITMLLRSTTGLLLMPSKIQRGQKDEPKNILNAYRYFMLSQYLSKGIRIWISTVLVVSLIKTKVVVTSSFIVTSSDILNPDYRWQKLKNSLKSSSPRNRNDFQLMKRISTNCLSKNFMKNETVKENDSKEKPHLTFNFQPRQSSVSLHY